MPYVDVGTKAVSDVLPAAHVNAIRTNQEYFARNFPHCTIKETTPQSVANNTEADLTSNEEVSDIGGMHSTAVNTARITIPAGEAGLYRASCVVTFAGDANGYRQVVFRINDTTNYSVLTLHANETTAAVLTLGGTRSFSMVAGDFITCRAYHTAGAALDVTLEDFTVEWRAAA